MTDIIDTKTVREARASARKIARGGQRTYQQALDDVARGAGHDHWSAFVRANPGETRATGAAVPEVPARRHDTRAFIQAFVSGEVGQRNQAALENDAIEESREEDFLFYSTPLTRRLKPAFTAGLYSITWGWITLMMRSDWIWLGMAIATTLAVLLLQGLALLVGDHPSMALRRAQLLLIGNMAALVGVGVAAFSALMYYRYPGVLVLSPLIHHVTNLDAIQGGLTIAGFFRIVATQGVKAMAIEAPATVMRIEGTVPPTRSLAPNWLIGIHDAILVLCVTAGVIASLTCIVVLPLWIMGFNTHGAGDWATWIIMGVFLVGYGLHKISSHFRALGYLPALPKGKAPQTTETRTA